MPGSNRVAFGNEIYDIVISPTSPGQTVVGTVIWSATTVAANTTTELTATIPGLQVNDFISFQLANAPIVTGLQIVNERVSAPNTAAVQWVNVTGGALTVPTATWIMNLTRPESPTALPPNAI